MKKNRIIAAAMAAAAMAMASCTEEKTDKPAAAQPAEQPAASAAEAPAATPAPAAAPAQAPAAAPAPAMPLGSIKSIDDAIAVIKNKDAIEGLEKLKAGEQDINTSIYSVLSPITFAVQQKNRDMVAFFLSLGADVNGVATDCKYSSNTMVMAAAVGDQALVRELVKAGADINLATASDTPFTSAASGQDIEMMKTLVELGADPKAADPKGRTALMVGLRRNGISMGKIDFKGVADYLIDTCGIDPNAKDKDGMTALMHACVFLSVDELEYLISKGADPTAKTEKQEGLVYFITKSGDPAKALDQLKALEKYNLDFNNGTNEKDITPLYNVISSSMKCKASLPLLEYMVEHGSRTDVVWGTCGYPTLYVAAGNNIADGPELLQYLLDKKVGDVNEVNRYGTTALMNVRKPCMVEPLIKAGADPTIKDKDGKTAYQLKSKDAKLKAAFEAAGVTE